MIYIDIVLSLLIPIALIGFTVCVLVWPISSNHSGEEE